MISGRGPEWALTGCRSAWARSILRGYTMRGSVLPQRDARGRLEGVYIGKQVSTARRLGQPRLPGHLRAFSDCDESRD